MSGGTKKPDPPQENQRTTPKKPDKDKKVAQSSDKNKDKRRV